MIKLNKQQTLKLGNAKFDIWQTLISLRPRLRLSISGVVTVFLHLGYFPVISHLLIADN
jgi:hypothetical protein